MERVHKIRKALQIPLGVDVALLLILLLLAYFMNGSTAERAALLILFFPTLFSFVETLYRKVSINDSGVSIKKFFRLKELGWNDITHAGHLTIRKKVYLLLTTVKGYYIISNAYEDFAGIITDVCKRLPKENVDEQLAGQMENPIRQTANVVAAWAAAVIMLGIIITKFYPLA